MNHFWEVSFYCAAKQPPFPMPRFRPFAAHQSHSSYLLFWYMQQQQQQQPIDVYYSLQDDRQSAPFDENNTE